MGRSSVKLLMRYPDRVTMCVSWQGSAWRARSAQPPGVAARNLSAAEDACPRLAGARAMATGVVPGGPGRRRWVFMAMGKPLADLLERADRGAPDHCAAARGPRHLPRAVGFLSDPSALRAIRSSPGKASAPRRSLHAPDDDLRNELGSVNRRWQVAEVLDSGLEHAAASGRRVSIEYAMIRDVNDQPWRADLLGELLAERAWPT